MTPLSFPTIPADTASPSSIVGDAAVGDCKCAAQHLAGPVLHDSIREAVGAVLLRRIKYIGRWLYWAARHRSTKHVAWVLAFEGYTWN